MGGRGTDGRGVVARRRWGDVMLPKSSTNNSTDVRNDRTALDALIPLEARGGVGAARAFWGRLAPPPRPGPRITEPEQSSGETRRGGGTRAAPNDDAPSVFNSVRVLSTERGWWRRIDLGLSPQGGRTAG